MPTYVSLIRLTQKGRENLKSLPQRVAENAKIREALGGRLIGAYATFGRYDFVLITEYPNSQAVLQAVAKGTQQGMASVETVEAIPIEEFTKIVAKI
jgi:uncharacterized protein with GYD domain